MRQRPWAAKASPSGVRRPWRFGNDELYHLSGAWLIVVPVRDLSAGLVSSLDRSKTFMSAVPAKGSFSGIGDHGHD